MLRTCDIQVKQPERSTLGSLHERSGRRFLQPGERSARRWTERAGDDHGPVQCLHARAILLPGADQHAYDHLGVLSRVGAIATGARSAACLSARNCMTLILVSVRPILAAVSWMERLSRKRQVRTSRSRSGRAWRMICTRSAALLLFTRVASSSTGPSQPVSNRSSSELAALR